MLEVGLGCYKWYQSQTPGDVPTRMLMPGGGWTRGSVPARMLSLEGKGGLGRPISIGEREQMPARTLGLEGEWIMRSHIGGGGERNIPYKDVEPSPYSLAYAF